MARADPHRQAVGIVRLRAAGPRRRQLAAQDRERIPLAAAGGIRLVVGELRTDVTKTHKDARGRLRHNDVEHRDPQAAIAWLWRVPRPREERGRALRPRASDDRRRAERQRLVVPSSQRMPATRWSSHKDIAAKALQEARRPARPGDAEQARAGRSSAPTLPTTRPRPRRASGSEPSASRSSPRPTTASERRAGRGSRRGRVARQPPAGGPTRHPRVARPGGRAGGGGSARHRARATRPKGAPRWPAPSNRKPLTERASATRAARPTASGIEQAARALLTTDGWQRWIRVRATNGLSQVQPAQSVADRARVPRARHHPDLRRRLPRLPRAQPLRAQGRDGDPHPRPGHRQGPRRARRGDRRAASLLPHRPGLGRLDDRRRCPGETGPAHAVRRADHGRQPPAT